MVFFSHFVLFRKNIFLFVLFFQSYVQVRYSKFNSILIWFMICCCEFWQRSWIQCCFIDGCLFFSVLHISCIFVFFRRRLALSTVLKQLLTGVHSCLDRTVYLIEIIQMVFHMNVYSLLFRRNAAFATAATTFTSPSLPLFSGIQTFPFQITITILHLKKQHYGIQFFKPTGKLHAPWILIVYLMEFFTLQFAYLIKHNMEIVAFFRSKVIQIIRDILCFAMCFITFFWTIFSLWGRVLVFP